MHRLYPWQYYYYDGHPVLPTERGMPQAPNGKARLIQALMKQGTPPGDWEWIRHEDWELANDNAAKFN